MPQQGHPPKVLVFDSGLGGLTVAREIRALLPQVELLYYADSAFFPYGIREEPHLQERVLEEVLYLQQRYQPAMVVLACNTASTLVLPQLRARTQTPIVGVVPAVKPAAENSSSGVIGLLATPGTVLREYTTELIRQHAGHCEVISVGSRELVEMAEGKMRGEPVSESVLRDILAPFHRHPRATELDTIVLACTHFPLLAEELQAAYGNTVQWLDSGRAIARRVQNLLAQSHDLTSLCNATGHQIISSAALPQAHKLRTILDELGFSAAPQVLTRFD